MIGLSTRPIMLGQNKHPNALHIRSLSAILVATLPLLPSVTLCVSTGGSLKDTRSGDSTGTEFAKFTRPLESNCSLSLTKTLSGALSMIPEDSVFLSLGVKASTTVSSFSITRMSLFVLFLSLRVISKHIFSSSLRTPFRY